MNPQNLSLINPEIIKKLGKPLYSRKLKRRSNPLTLEGIMPWYELPKSDFEWSKNNKSRKMFILKKTENTWWFFLRETFCILIFFCSWNLFYVDFFSSWKFLYVDFSSRSLLQVNFCLLNVLFVDFSLIIFSYAEISFFVKLHVVSYFFMNFLYVNFVIVKFVACWVLVRQTCWNVVFFFMTLVLHWLFSSWNFLLSILSSSNSLYVDLFSWNIENVVKHNLILCTNAPIIWLGTYLDYRSKPNWSVVANKEINLEKKVCWIFFLRLVLY